FTVAGNPSSIARSTFVDVASKSIAITQDGVPCTFALSASSQSFGAAGGAGGVSVTAPGGCIWTQTSNAGWITPGSGGSGGGTAAFIVAANASMSSRTATVTVAGTPVAVTQAA